MSTTIEDEKNIKKLMEFTKEQILRDNKNLKNKFHVDIEWTPKYCWFLIPTIEINTSVNEVSLNIFCLGIYFCYNKVIRRK